MIHTKKMSLVPFQQGSGDPGYLSSSQTSAVEDMRSSSKRPNAIKEYARKRMTSIFNVILKLAKYGSYDTDGYFQLSNGERQDMTPLLQHCFSPGRNIRGLEEFVHILYKAGVNPDHIINSTVKEMLYSLERKPVRSVKGFNPVRSPIPVPETYFMRPHSPQEEPIEVSPHVPRSMVRHKRRREETEPDEVPAKVHKSGPLADWEPDDDSDDE